MFSNNKILISNLFINVMNKKEKEFFEEIKKFAEKLPKFPDGRINYSKSKTSPVLTCFIKYKAKILLLKRSDKVRTYKGKWNTVAGYIDELKPIKKKILAELGEELGISKNGIKSIKLGKRYEFFDRKIGKKWIIFPAIAELKNNKIRLNEEHTEYKWISAKEIKKYNTVPNFERSLINALKFS